MINLQNKFSTYLKLLPSQQDKHGFIQFDTYDSVGFSALLGCVPGTNVKLDDARVGNVWFRLPSSYENKGVGPGYKRSVLQRLLDCLKLKTTNATALSEEFERGSATISRDMLVMIAWYAWCNKRQDIAEGVTQYALRHFGIMGQGSPTKINIMPALLASFASISHKLGGPNRWWLTWVPADFGGTPLDYQAHLQVLHVLLRSRIVGKANWWYRRILKKQATRQPNNPLFQVAVGNTNTAIKLLSNEAWWPNDRLPTTADRAEPWLTQRDEGSAWQPAQGPAKAHSGADFLFTYCLAVGLLKP